MAKDTFLSMELNQFFVSVQTFMMIMFLKKMVYSKRVVSFAVGLGSWTIGAERIRLLDLEKIEFDLKY